MTQPSIDARLLAEAAAADDAIRSRAVRVVEMMFKDIEHQLQTAPANTRFAITQKILPILTKQLDTDKTNDEMSRLRDELNQYRDETAKALLGDHQLEVAEE